MKYADEQAYINAVTTELTAELQPQTPLFNADILAQKVKDAFDEVKMKRNYAATSMKDAAVLADMENYYSTVKNVARVDYAHIGAYGESAHTENGIERDWADREKLFYGIHAFVKIF